MGGVVLGEIFHDGFVVSFGELCFGFNEESGEEFLDGLGGRGGEGGREVGEEGVH